MTRSMPKRCRISKPVTASPLAMRARQQLDRRLRISHRGEGSLLILRPREQLQHGLRNDAERAFGADEDLLQIVAGAVLAQPAQAMPDLAIGQYHSSPSTRLRALPYFNALVPPALVERLPP